MNFVKNIRQDDKKINTLLGCILVAFTISLPLFTDFLLCGTKLSYQLIRIEALKNGLQQYGLHLWAKPEWINPMGHSIAFYYGDTFLYIPAVLNLMGLSVQASYRVFLILINVLTVLISYKVFEKVFADKYIGVLGSALYSASIYRVFLMYGEAELGEILALVFLPLVLYGCYLLFVKDNASEESGLTDRIASDDKKWSYLWIALGLSGMLRSHILSFGITVIFVLLFAIISFKSFRKSKTWIQLGLSVGMFLLLNLNYLYTMFRYVTCGLYVINPVSGQPIQAKGIQLAQLFMCFYQAGGSHEFGANGIANAVPVGLGFVLLIGILTFIYLVFVHGEEYNKKIKNIGYKLLVLGVLACYLSVLAFPWDGILKMSGVASSIVSMIQQPWHFLQIALLAFSALGCIGYVMLRQKNALYGKIYGVGLVIATLLFSSYLAANMLFTYEFVRVNTMEEIPYAEIAGMGIQVEMMHSVWYVLTAVAILTLGANIVFYVKDAKKRV